MYAFENIYSVEFFHIFRIPSENLRLATHAQSAGENSPGKASKARRVLAPVREQRRRRCHHRLQSGMYQGSVVEASPAVQQLLNPQVQPMITRVHRARGTDDNRDPAETNASSIPDAAATPAQANTPHPLAS
jgi:hypothetical protein